MNNIRKVMKEKGIEDIRPSKEILEKMDIKIHTWNKFLEGKKDPSLKQLDVIASFLGCEVSELITERHESASV